jgi:hypothetical protein
MEGSLFVSFKLKITIIVKTERFKFQGFKITNLILKNQ